MKPLCQITQKDLERHPVWVYQGNDDDCASVVATELFEVSENDSRCFIVATDVILNNRIHLSGFMSPQDASGLDYLQPVIIFEGIHFSISRAEALTAFLETFLLYFGAPPSEIFPIVFKARIPVDGKIIQISVSAEQGAAANP